MLGLLFFLAASAWASPETGAPPGASQLTTELSWGHEQQTSPLFRFSPEGTLVLLPGFSKLAGSYVSLAAGGMRDWAWGDTTRLVLSGNAVAKHAPSARDLDFSSFSGNLALRWPVAGGSLGLGPGLQHLRIAGTAFRDVHTLHADWTLGDGADGHYVLIADWSANSHPADFSDLDSRVLTLSAHRRVAGGLPWVDAVDLEFGGWRERNAHGFRDLANRSLFARISAEKRLGAFGVSLGYLVQQARFDESLLPDLPARRDRAGFLDLTIDWEWEQGRSLRLEVNRGRNDANVAIYESRYRQAGLTLNLEW